MLLQAKQKQPDVLHAMALTVLVLVLPKLILI
jgi:hypothetical protein